ncbi:failed axon connections homolog [Macrobrachium nipponense]|uniref:failed axon connections homolog n=1 Tax=Macrobrachium nipponense TaxID=159736 RepID=UPI0030C87B1F
MWTTFSNQPAVLGVTTVIAGLSVIWVFRKIARKHKRNQLRKQWNNAGKDVVVLHQFIRGKYCINLSPFAVKVESFLRLADIKYVVDSQLPFGPKGKCPWITLNGEELGDSELIVQKLSEYFKVDLDSHLDTRKKAQLETVRITADEFVFWFVITWRYWIDGCESFLKSQSFSSFLNVMFPLFMKRGIKVKARYQGIGHHTPDEIYGMAKRTCGALADVLGDDPFFGGEQPSTADCSVFGQLSQLMWNAPGSQYEALVTEVYPSLREYCNRMKEKIFPDWNKLLNPPLE